MTKEEFIKEKEFLEDKIKTLKESIKLLTNEYINDNKPFEIGAKIKNKQYSDFGIVYGFELHYDNTIKPLAYKVKKDGNPSKHNMYIYKLDQVELSLK